MKKRPVAIFQIGIISFFLFADQNLIGPNLTLIAEDFGLSEKKDQYIGGLIPLVFWLFGGTVTLFVGYFTDLTSRKNLFVSVILIGEIPCLLTGFASNYFEFFLMRALTGIGIGGIIPLTYSLLGDFYDSKIGKIKFHRFSYDFCPTQRKILNEGLPPYLAERLAKGY